MNNLDKNGMIDVVKNVIDSGKPFLGICLGMQLYLITVRKAENCKGLGILAAIKLLPFETLRFLTWGGTASKYRSNAAV